MTEVSIREWYKTSRASIYETRAKIYYINKFKRLATTIFKWEIDNDSINPDVIENYLFDNGNCLIYNNPVFGVSVALSNPQGYDINGIPKLFRPTYDNLNEKYEQKSIGIDDSVFITDVPNWRIKRSDAMFLIDDIIDVEETIRQQVFNQKTPLMAIAGTKAQKQKLKNSVVDIGENMKVLFVDNDITESIKPLNLNAPYNVQSLTSYKRELENEIMEYIGCDTTPPDGKKERMIYAEVEGNDEILNYFLSDGLKSRRKACEELKKKFDITAYVDIQDNVRPIKEDEQSSSNEGDNNDN